MSATRAAGRAAATSRVELDALGDGLGDGVEALIERRRLIGLHETQVTLRHDNVATPLHRTEHRDADARHRLGNERRVSRPANHVEDHAGNVDVAPIALEAERDGGCRLGLRFDVEHEHDRPAGERREVRGRAVAARAACAGAVVESHDALGDADFCIGAGVTQQARDERRAHGPGVEVDAGAAGGGGVERRVDVVGSALEGLHGDAAPAQSAQQAERYRRLAGARSGRGDDHAAG